MYGVELYSKVRMAVLRDGLSGREAARRFGIDRGTVAKMVGHSVPPGYRQGQPRVRPKLDAHASFIDGNRPLSTRGQAAFGVASRTDLQVQGSSSSRCFGL